MKSSKTPTAAKVFFQEKSYLWPEMCLKNKLAITHPSALSTELVMVPAEDVLTTVRCLLYGFKEKKTVFPVSREFCSDRVDIDQSEVALAIASSGSQQKSKIVQLTFQNIEAHCRHFIKIIPIDSASIWLNCLPLSHIAGVMIIYRCWFNQASMLLHENFHAEKIWQDIHHYGITHLSLVPRMLFKLLELSGDLGPPESLQYVLVGGDQLSAELFQRAIAASWPIYISYGMSEACSTVAIGRTPDKLKILDGFKTQLSEHGVLKLKGDMIFSGYTNVPLKVSHDQWFYTHDRVHLKNNELTFIARDDHMIISGGRNISPAYMESLLYESNISGDFAVGKISNSSYSNCLKQIKDQNWGDTIVILFCVDNKHSAATEIAELRSWIKQNLSSAYQPGLVLDVKLIPRNTMGKINRKAVQTIIDNLIEEQ